MDWFTQFETVEQPSFVYHQLRIAMLTDGQMETIDEIRSQSPLPVPRVGETLSVSHDTVTLDDEGEPTADTDTLPKDDGDLFEVEDVGHYYMLVSPEGPARDRYSEGIAVHTTVFVTLGSGPE